VRLVEVRRRERVNDDLQPLAPEAAVDLYLDSRRDEVTSETLNSHRYRLKMFVEWCEENSITNMNDLSGRDPHAYRVDRLDDGDLNPVTLRGQLSTLRAFLRFCASVDAVPTPPGGSRDDRTRSGPLRNEAFCGR